MGTRPGFYKSGKRNKELARQKKQEEKKLRRLNKSGTTGPDIPEAVPEVPVLDSGLEGQDQVKRSQFEGLAKIPYFVPQY